MLELSQVEDCSGDIRIPVHLWFAYPEDELTGTATNDRVQMLSDEERARWRRFRFEKDRREYLTTRVLARTALSHYHPLSPAAWRFRVNDFGKPAVHPDCGLSFNLSNSTKMVVCLIAKNSPLGVDVEPFGRAKEIAELGNEVFSYLELAQLEGLPYEKKLDRALSLWTLKESYIKARGLGFALPLKQFSFVFDESGPIRLETEPGLNDDPTKWRFCLLSRAEHRVALAVESETDPQLQMWEVRPWTAGLVREPDGGERWFPSRDRQALQNPG